MGIGWYMNGISPDLANQVRTYTGGQLHVKHEQGIEVFHDYAITPAIRLIPSYQHIWNPLSAISAGHTDADLWMMRGAIVF